jgi:putative oxidoreductase
LIHTDGDVTSLVLRLTLAAVIFPHGAQKLLGWFGGYGLSGTMGFFTEQVGLPGLLAFLVIFIEFFGAVALAAGVLGRAAAAGIASVMVGAVLTTHLPYGFFMNWSGAQGGEGFEFHLLAIGIALALVLKGSGAASVDRWWTEERLAA